MAKYLDSTGLTYLWGKITAAFQAKVTASGLLKGDGSGGVTAATSGTDYDVPEMFLITCTLEDDTITSPSKTLAEIQTAIADGKYPILIANDSLVFNYYQKTSGVRFIRTSSATEIVVVQSSGTWTYQAYDLQQRITASGILKGNGSGGVSAATAGTDYVSSPEVFTVKITVSNNSVTADKNISDIYAAYTAGKLCVAEYISANDIYGTAFITRIASDFVRFEGLFFEPQSRPSKLIFDGEIYNGTDTWLRTVQNLPNWYDVTATTGMLKGDSSGQIRAAVADTDYMAARSITNNTSTSTSITANTNLITANTLRYHTNRTTSVAASDTNYSTVMARGIAAGTSGMTAGTTSLTSGTIYLQYDA